MKGFIKIAVCISFFFHCYLPISGLKAFASFTVKEGRTSKGKRSIFPGRERRDTVKRDNLVFISPEKKDSKINGQEELEKTDSEANNNSPISVIAQPEWKDIAKFKYDAKKKTEEENTLISFPQKNKAGNEKIENLRGRQEEKKNIVANSDEKMTFGGADGTGNKGSFSSNNQSQNPWSYRQSTPKGRGKIGGEKSMTTTTTGKGSLKSQVTTTSTSHEDHDDLDCCDSHPKAPFSSASTSSFSFINPLIISISTFFATIHYLI